MTNIIPKKSLGQNFLHDKNIAKKIVNALALQDNDLIVEIGAGTGFLTKELLQNNIFLLAYEIDKRAIETLNSLFSTSSNIEIIHQDFLETNFEDILKHNNADSIKIVGNLPYNISSQILFKLFDNRNFISKAIIMLQKEVAQRLNANIKTKEYGILSVATNLIGKARILFDVSPHCFYPQPAVMSSIVEIVFHKNQTTIIDYKAVMEFVRAAFSQRRKKLKNSLSSYLNKKCSININILEDIAMKNDINYFSKRAEELTVDDFIKFYTFLKSF